METTNLNIRLPAALMARLRNMTTQSDDPLAPSLSKTVRRGIELALAEIEAAKTAKAAAE